jgi:hypothetical protein
MMSARRTGLIALLIGAGAFTSACLQSTEPQPSLLGLNGTWNYVAVQTGPVRENLTGKLTISRESGASFQGQLEVVGVNEQTGQSRVLNGPVSGAESGVDVIDFDANLEASPRRHVGNIAADVITGTWIGSSSDGTMSSGTFRIERVAQ